MLSPSRSLVRGLLAGALVCFVGSASAAPPAGVTAGASVEGIGEYALADKAQTNSAVDAAKRAFPAWSVGSIQDRATLLDKVGVHLESFADSNGKVADLEPLGL